MHLVNHPILVFINVEQHRLTIPYLDSVIGIMRVYMPWANEAFISKFEADFATAYSQAYRNIVIKESTFYTTQFSAIAHIYLSIFKNEWHISIRVIKIGHIGGKRLSIIESMRETHDYAVNNSNYDISAIFNAVMYSGATLPSTPASLRSSDVIVVMIVNYLQYGGYLSGLNFENIIKQVLKT